MENMSLIKFTEFIGFLLGFLLSADAICNFPSALQSTWLSSYRGRTITFNQTHIDEYLISNSLSTDSFECFMNSGNKYIAKSVHTHNAFSNTLYCYVCLEIIQIDSNKFKYYIQTSDQTEQSSEPIMRRSSDPGSLSEVCDMTRATEQYYIMIKSGYENVTNINIPGPLQSKYTYTVDGNCNAQTELDVCTDKTTLAANLTLCANKVAYSAEGKLHVLYSLEKNGLHYISLYNQDASGIDNNNYYQFVCLVAARSGNTIEATARGGYCAAGQTAKTGGTQVLRMTSVEYCGPDDPAPTVHASQDTTPKSSAGRHFNFHITLMLSLLLSIFYHGL